MHKLGGDGSNEDRWMLGTWWCDWRQEIDLICSKLIFLHTTTSKSFHRRFCKRW